MRDRMTPKERMAAFGKGQEIDRIPCMPQMGVTMAPAVGIPTHIYYTSGEKMAEAEIALFHKIKSDSTGIGISLRGIAEAMGSVVAYPENRIPYLKEPVLKNIMDAQNLSPANPYKDGKLPLFLKALQILQKEIGHLVDVGSDIPAPFTAAAMVFGTENLLKEMIRHPKEVHTLLEIVTETNLRVVDAFAELGVDLGMSDPVASASLISVKQFREFAMPYSKKCIDRMTELTGRGTSIHMCGKSKDIWESLVETGMTSFSIDNAEDLEEAKKAIGDRVCLSGNVKPVDTMKNGTIEDIMDEARECIRKCYDNPKVFVLSTGCQIPLGTPVENVLALMDAAREFGAYPLDLEKLKSR